MTPEQLRASILQYAMEGKLVKQDPSDEPASELIKKIENKKAELIKEGKIKKSKKLPAITDDEKPFDIPDNWAWSRLGDLFTILRGGSPRPIKSFLTNDENGINWIKIGDTDPNSKYITKTEEKIIPEGLKKSRAVHIGDFVLSNSMSFGRPYILKINGAVHDGWLIISDYDQVFNKDFLYYLLLSSFVKKQFSIAATGSTVKNLNRERVANTIGVIPPLEEQKRIVAKIEKLMPVVDEYAESYNRLQKIDNEFEDKLKQSVLQYAMEGKLVKQNLSDEPASELIRKIENEKAELIKEGKIKKSKKLPAITDDEKPFDIPNSWEWVRLESISILKNGKTPKKQDISFKGKYPYFKVRDMNNNRIYMKNVKNYVGDKYKKQLMPKDTIIFPKNGGAVLTAKKRILVENSLVDLNTSGIIPLSPTYYKYIFYLFSSLDIRNYVKGTALPTIDSKKLKATPVPLPPLKEQKRIVAKIQKLQDSISSLSK